MYCSTYYVAPITIIMYVSIFFVMLPSTEGSTYYVSTKEYEVSILEGYSFSFPWCSEQQFEVSRAFCGRAQYVQRVPYPMSYCVTLHFY